MDQVLQQTINKDEESKLGLIGLTMKNQHWLDGSLQGVLLQITLNHSVHFQKTPSKIRHHKELGNGRKNYDENVLKVMDFESSFQNPYDLDTLKSELSDIITEKPLISEYAYDCWSSKFQCALWIPETFCLAVQLG